MPTSGFAFGYQIVLSLFQLNEFCLWASDYFALAVHLSPQTEAQRGPFLFHSIVTWHRDLPLQHCLAGNKHSHNEKGAAIQLHLHLAVQHTLLFLRYHWVSTAALATLCAHQYHCWSWEMKPHCILLTCFHFVWALFGAVFLKHLVSGSIITEDFSVSFPGWSYFVRWGKIYRWNIHIY